MKKLVWFLILCLFVPVAALAVTEGVVEAAAPVDVSVTVAEAEASYMPDPSYYAWDNGYVAWCANETYVEPEFDGENYYPCVQVPCLTSGEKIRAKKLLDAYQKGEAKGDGSAVLGATENVVLGVYPLNPEDYDGEKVFVILPNTSITDELMLAMIDAYAQLGLTFDPEGLSYRNCMRGGGIECSRFFTDEERTRYSTLNELIRRGSLTGVEARGILSVSLDARYFNGLDGFSFRPYRRMTDEELAGHLVALGVHDERAELDFEGVERLTRELLTRAFSCPLSMKLDNIGNESSYVPQIFDDRGNAVYAREGRTAIYAGYAYPKDGYEQVIATVLIDAEKGMPVSMSLTDIPVGWIQSEAPRDPAVPDETYFAIAQAYVEEKMSAYIRNPGALVWQMPEQNEWWTNYGLGVCVKARIPETNEMLSICVGCGDMQVHNVDIEADQRGWFEDVEFKKEDRPVNG